MSIDDPIKNENVKKFRGAVTLTCPSLVSRKEQYVMRALPLSMFETALSNVFHDDLKLARDVLYERIDDVDDSGPAQEVLAISTMNVAADYIVKAIDEYEPILVISDVDADGELSQSIAMEAKRIMDIGSAEPHLVSVQSRDYNPQNHGFSIDQIENWLIEKDIPYDANFNVVVVDLGTNQRDTQESFLAKYPNANLVICDHHKPDIDFQVVHSCDRSCLVSPFVKGATHLSLQRGGGASGGYLLYSVLKTAFEKRRADNSFIIDDIAFELRMGPLRDMGKAANLLDGVGDIRLKPLRTEDVAKALDISALAKKGGSFGKWISHKQPERIFSLQDLIGTEGVDALMLARQKALEQNHLARAIYELIPEIMSPEGIKGKLSSAIAAKLSSLSTTESVGVNYLEKISPYLYNFSYENQFDERLKTDWLSFAKNCFSASGRIEKGILETVRQFKLISEVSNDLVMVTQPVSTDVEKVFTSKQLSRAYHSLSKAVNLSVASTKQNQIVLHAKSEVPMPLILGALEKAFVSAQFSFRGHANVGGLTVVLPKGELPHSFLKEMVDVISDAAKAYIEQQPLPEVIKVNPTQLPLLKEIMTKMRLHLDSASAPTLLLEIEDEMTIEDSYTLKKQTIKELVAQDEWVITAEGLDFSGDTSLLLPNQALKAVSNSDFNSYLGLKLLPTGSFMASEVYSLERLGNQRVPEIKMPLEKERVEMMSYYDKHFKDKDIPLIPISRKQASEALKFTSDGSKVYDITEATVLGVLRETTANAHVILDFEADGAGNSQATNIGLAIFERNPDSAIIMSREKFFEMVESSPESIKNYFEMEDGNIQVNEELKYSLFSLLIKSDGGVDIRVSIKAQNLTNLTRESLQHGCTTEFAQQKTVELLNSLGLFVVQAHNLPYDNNIMRVNFPEAYEIMSNNIHLDSAITAKEKQIAYVNLMTVSIGSGRSSVDFYDAPHEGYNLSTLLTNPDLKSFDFPSVKGNKILRVRGDEVQMFDPETRIATSLPESRLELFEAFDSRMKPIQVPRYSIEKILRMSTIYDMISQQPVKENVLVDFDAIGLGSGIDNELWSHFQEHYAYDLDPTENLHRFMALPEVQHFAAKQFTMDYKEAPKQLLDGRNIGNSEVFDPNKKYKTKKAADEALKTMNLFTGRDVLMTNILSYVKANPENAERYSLTWVYDMVLDKYESTSKASNKGLYEGVSQSTGVDVSLVEKIYAEAYMYREHRGIGSYKIHETHNNIGLEGDVHQEVNGVMYMLNNKIRNPYLVGKYAMRNLLNPYQPSIDALKKQCARSTFSQTIRRVTNIALDSDELTSFSAKQIENFSDDGVSIKNSSGSIPKMRFNKIGSEKIDVEIELMSYSAEAFRTMPMEERHMWEDKVKKALGTLLLANSRSKLKLDSEKALVERVVNHPDLIQNLVDLREKFGPMYASKRTGQMKDMLAGFGRAIMGDVDWKVPINKEMNLNDIDLIQIGVEESITELMNKQGFESYVDMGDIKPYLDSAKGQFLAFEESRKTGTACPAPAEYPELDRFAKSQITIMLKQQDNLYQEHLNAFPELVSSFTSTKDDALSFLIKSELLSYAIDVPNMKPDAPENEASPDLRRRIS